MSSTETRINPRRVMRATVVSDKMNKTRVVRVDITHKHDKYQKTLKSAVKFKAHDEKNESKSGDVVEIMESRPLSKDKRWIIREIVQKAA